MADSTLFTSLGQLLGEQGWNFHRIPGREVLELAFEAEHGRVHLLVQAFPPIGAIGITSEAPMPLEPTHRAKVAELLMRTNLELTIGNFEMDWDSLRVFFRTTNLFGEAVPPREILAGMLHAAVAEMDRMLALCRELARASGPALQSLDIGRLIRLGPGGAGKDRA